MRLRETHGASPFTIGEFRQYGFFLSLSAMRM